MTAPLKDCVEFSLACVALLTAWANLISLGLTILATLVTITWGVVRLSETDWWKRLSKRLFGRKAR